MPDARTFDEVYEQVVEAYTGDLTRDLAERSIPSDCAKTVAVAAGGWAAHSSRAVAGSREDAGSLGFFLGLQVGVEWARAGRPSGDTE